MSGSAWWYGGISPILSRRLLCYATPQEQHLLSSICFVYVASPTGGAGSVIGGTVWMRRGAAEVRKFMLQFATTREALTCWQTIGSLSKHNRRSLRALARQRRRDAEQQEATGKRDREVAADTLRAGEDVTADRMDEPSFMPALVNPVWTAKLAGFFPLVLRPSNPPPPFIDLLAGAPVARKTSVKRPKINSQGSQGDTLKGDNSRSLPSSDNAQHLEDFASLKGMFSGTEEELQQALAELLLDVDFMRQVEAIEHAWRSLEENLSQEVAAVDEMQADVSSMGGAL
eukprot:jgi/Mesvir1/6049/Mv00784-RA.1